MATITPINVICPTTFPSSLPTSHPKLFHSSLIRCWGGHPLTVQSSPSRFLWSAGCPDNTDLLTPTPSSSTKHSSLAWQSQGNVVLTQKGMQDAKECGRRTREIIESDGAPDWKGYFYVSPYTRTLETLRSLGKAFESSRISGVREEPRLREQDLGFRETLRKEIEIGRFQPSGGTSGQWSNLRALTTSLMEHACDANRTWWKIWEDLVALTVKRRIELLHEDLSSQKLVWQYHIFPCLSTQE